MTRNIYMTVLGAVALLASACAQSVISRPSATAYVPRGQAAQPGGWNGSEQAVGAPDGSVRGRAAQPGSWLPGPPENRAPRQYATGIPAGQAAQPGAWMRSVQ
jgi:hypothetical protein